MSELAKADAEWLRHDVVELLREHAGYGATCVHLEELADRIERSLPSETGVQDGQHLANDLHEAMRIMKRLSEIISATPKEAYKDWVLGPESPYDMVRVAEKFLSAPRSVTPPSATRSEAVELAEAYLSLRRTLISGEEVSLLCRALLDFARSETGSPERDLFNAAINFALDEAGPEGMSFLELWREGAWSEIASEFPGFKSAAPQAAAVTPDQGQPGKQIPAAAAPLSAIEEIEDALWALLSYEQNRDDAGRVYSEADITRMAEALRALKTSLPSSIEQSRNDQYGDLWTGELIEACKRAGWYLPSKSKGLPGYYPSEAMRAFKDGYESGRVVASSSIGPTAGTPHHLASTATTVIEAPSAMDRITEEKIREVEDSDEVQRAFKGYNGGGLTEYALIKRILLVASGSIDRKGQTNG